MSETVSRRTVTVDNENGLHLVPCSLIARLAREHECSVHVLRESTRVDAKNVLELMTLGAVRGTELELVADGPDAERAVDRLAALFASRFEVDESRESSP